MTSPDLSSLLAVEKVRDLVEHRPAARRSPSYAARAIQRIRSVRGRDTLPITSTARTRTV